MKKSFFPYDIAAAVAVFTLLLYLPALQNGFVNWDDDVYVVDKYQIRSLDLAFFKWAITDLSLGFWHPITWISYAVDYAVWGLNPLGYHLTGIVLHGLNTFLVVLLVSKLLHALHAGPQETIAVPGMLGKPAFPGRRHALIAAGVAGTLFGIHPLHVESVAWIAERKDLLCALFFLLSIIVYLDYAAKVKTYEASTSSGVRTYLDRRYLLSLGLFILALSSKTMAVSLPAVLLILDWYPLKRAHRLKDGMGLFIEKLPFILFSLIISILSILSQKTYGALSQIDTPLLSRILVAFKSLVLYLRKMVWPVDLVPLYTYPKDISLTSFEYLSAICFIGVITGLAVYMAKKNQALPSAWMYYVITLLPVLGFVQVGFFPMADRFTYLPSIGPFLLAGLASAWLWARMEALKHRATAIAKVLAVAAVILVCAALFSLTLKQISIWRDSIDFWSYVIEQEPDVHPVAYHNRGLAFREAGMLERAIEDMSAAIERESGEVANVYNSRGSTFVAMGRHISAMEDLNKAITLDPEFADAFTNRGMAQENIGQVQSAIKDYSMAISLDPTQLIAYYNRANVFITLGRPDLAIEDLTQALAVNPYFAKAYLSRGLAFEQVGRPDLAFDDYTSAVKADPSLAKAYNNRGLLLQRAGRLKEALMDLDRAIEQDPKSLEAFTNRGLVFEDMGQFDRSIEDYNRAIEIDPKDPLSYSNRGIAFEKMGRISDAMKDQDKACSLGYNPGCAALQSLAALRGPH